jgi:hypothetical protein
MTTKDLEGTISKYFHIEPIWDLHKNVPRAAIARNQ